MNRIMNQFGHLGEVYLSFKVYIANVLDSNELILNVCEYVIIVY